MTIVNLSFAACGFMGIYHLGAVGAFLRHGDKMLGSLRACAGASAGALVAAVLITAPDKLEHCTEFTYRFAESVRQQRFGAVTPGYNFMLTLREGIEKILPSEAHSLASDRLYVSITHSRSGKNHIVSRFTSRDELIMALLASSFVPVYAGFRPVEFNRQKWIDGGFTDSLPILSVGRTITVSPFAGLQDVCPVHRGRFNTELSLANMKIMSGDRKKNPPITTITKQSWKVCGGALNGDFPFMWLHCIPNSAVSKFRVCILRRTHLKDATPQRRDEGCPNSKDPSNAAH